MENREFFYNVTSNVLEVPTSEVKKLGATEFLTLGYDNKFLRQIEGLFKNVSVLRSLVEGSALLSSGLFQTPDGMSLDMGEVMTNVFLYGWCPILVRQSFDKKKFHLTPLDPRFVRTNEDKSKFAYSEQEGFRNKIEYPAFGIGVDGSSILYIGVNDLEHPYSLPIWSSALKEVSILKKVADYHNNSMDNGFMGTYIINMNNGMPSPEDKAEIERLVNKKFCGSDNAGRVLISFNDGKDNEASLQSLSTEDTSNRYGDLIRSCKEALFTSFRASSQLFGCPDGSETALTATEYSYKLSLFIQFCLSPICRKVQGKLSDFGVVLKDPMGLVRSLVSNSEE